MANHKKHISVCICTYKRPQLLKRLLSELNAQETHDLFSYSVVVADNDQLHSAEAVVSDFARASTIPVKYYVEPRQNISLARNTAVSNADGDFIAFIDDDEFPIKRWLLTLFEACNIYRVDGVLGSVRRHFDEEPPRWVVEGNFYERPTYPTGFVIDWTKGRTGNVLLKRDLFRDSPRPFNPEFRTGEDQDFFRKKIAGGHTFIWCNEAVAYEVVLPVRWKRSFMLKRALLRGTMSLHQPTSRLHNIAKSAVAVPAYMVALPFTLLVGQHRFMRLLVSLFDHLGRLLAFFGIKPVKSQYVTD